MNTFALYFILYILVLCFSSFPLFLLLVLSAETSWRRACQSTNNLFVFYWCVNLNQWFEGQVKSKRKENGGIAYDLQCYANGEYCDVYSSPEDRI